MRTIAGLLLGILLFAVPSGRLWQAFQSHVRLTDSEISSVERGDIVSKVLPSKNEREVAAFGMIRVDAPGEVLLTRFRDITNFKKAEQVLEIGKFGATPSLQDLQTLTLTAEDIDEIRTCRVGQCGLRLSSSMIERLRRGAPAGDPSQLFRQLLLEYVQSYLVSGNSALVKYADKTATTSLASEFQDLLTTAPYLREYSPDFFAYLQNFPRGKPQGADDFLYWSKEKFGLKPVISITHVFLYRPSTTDDVLIVSKQIYASHYFHSSIGLTGSVARTGRPQSYLFYLNRSRVDALGGMFSGVLTNLIRGQIQDGLTTNLKLAKQRLERP